MLYFISSVRLNTVFYSLACLLLTLSVYAADPIQSTDQQAHHNYLHNHLNACEHQQDQPSSTALLKGCQLLAEQGVAYAQNQLGLQFLQQQPENYPDAVNWFNKAAQQGEQQAQYNLGLLYLQGKGVEQNYAIAKQWFQRAALQGLQVAQYNLAMLYRYGYGLETDYPQAFLWFRLAALQGNCAAQQQSQPLTQALTPEQIKHTYQQAAMIARNWIMR